MPSSHSTGRAPTKSWQLAPAPQRIPRTVLLPRQSPCIWIFLPICPALILAGAYRFIAASTVSTPTTVASCRGFCQRGWHNERSTTSPRNPPDTTSHNSVFRLLFNDSKWKMSAQQLLQDIPPLPRHTTRCFDSSSTTRSGKYYRIPIGFAVGVASSR